MHSATTLTTLNSLGLVIIHLLPGQASTWSSSFPSASDLSLLPCRPSDPCSRPTGLKAYRGPHRTSCVLLLAELVATLQALNTPWMMDTAGSLSQLIHQGNKTLLHPGSLQTLKVNTDNLFLMPIHKFLEFLKAKCKRIKYIERNGT